MRKQDLKKAIAYFNKVAKKQNYFASLEWRYTNKKNKMYTVVFLSRIRMGQLGFYDYDCIKTNLFTMDSFFVTNTISNMWSRVLNIFSKNGNDDIMDLPFPQEEDENIDLPYSEEEIKITVKNDLIIPQQLPNKEQSYESQEDSYTNEFSNRKRIKQSKPLRISFILAQKNVKKWDSTKVYKSTAYCENWRKTQKTHYRTS